MAGHPDDMRIITEVLDGDVNAFEQLLARYESTVARVVAAHVPGPYVEEVAHEAFIKAYKSLSRYKPIKPFPNWLTTIATRSCHDFWRTRYRRQESSASELSEDGQAFLETAMTMEAREHFDDMANQREAREVLDLVLDQLAPLDRMILALTYFEERSTRETAEMLDISVPNVKVRSFRAKRKLKDFLKKHGVQGELYAS